METSSVALVGYQVRFTPLAPWKFGRMPAESMGPKAVADSVIVARLLKDGVKNLLIAPGSQVATPEFQHLGADGPCAVRIGENGTVFIFGADVKDIGEVGSLGLDGGGRGWSIETDDYIVQWPEGYSVGSVDGNSKIRFGFERVGASNEMIVLRGPLVGADQVPTPDALVSADQELVEMDMESRTPWVEARYQVEGTFWRQRHYYVSVKPETIVLVTIQGPESRATQLAEEGNSVAASIRVRGHQ